MEQRHVPAGSVLSPHYFLNQKVQAMMIFAKYLKGTL
jgi:hypothetical protein